HSKLNRQLTVIDGFIISPTLTKELVRRRAGINSHLSDLTGWIVREE
ncbi:hypothetical protein scyTo_0019334, partial [Scyliorhinus torazame]|nr:hypothetical protein [Scyliorhinus torazame]